MLCGKAADGGRPVRGLLVLETSPIAPATGFGGRFTLSCAPPTDGFFSMKRRLFALSLGRISIVPSIGSLKLLLSDAVFYRSNRPKATPAPVIAAFIFPVQFGELGTGLPREASRYLDEAVGLE